MIARKFRPLFAAAFFALSGCSLEPDFVQLSFEGRVTDAATENAIVGASVSLVEALSPAGSFLVTETTDADGRYVLTYRDCGDVPFLTFEAEGYRTVGVSVSCTEDPQTIDIEMTVETAP
jgi:hypothetical protein